MCTKCVRLGKDKEPLGLHNAASRRRGQGSEASRRPAPSTSKTLVVVHDATRESPVVEVAMTIDMLGSLRRYGNLQCVLSDLCYLTLINHHDLVN